LDQTFLLRIDVNNVATAGTSRGKNPPD